MLTFMGEQKGKLMIVYLLEIIGFSLLKITNY
jgi:hypothetical protein